MPRRGLSQIITTVLLIVMAIAATLLVYTMFSNVFQGTNSGYTVTSENSLLTVNADTGTGMILLILNNHGPSPIDIYNITITDQGGNSLVIKPQNSTNAYLSCQPLPQTSCVGYPTITTGQIVGGSGVGMSGTAPNRFLVLPAGRQASIQFIISAGMDSSFTSGSSYRVLVNSANGPVVYFTLTATSE